MKHPTKKLLDDLLEDSAPPDFQAALMANTLRSARQRKRLRHFSAALGAVMVAGIFAFTFREMHRRTVSSTQTFAPATATASSEPANSPQVVGTKPDSALVVVQTSEATRPKEINDKELVSLLSNQPVALVRYASGRAELIFLDPSN